MSREAGRPPPAPERGPGPAAPPRQVRGRASRPGGGGGKRRRQRAGRSAAAAPGQSGTTGWPCGGRRARPRPGRGRLRLTAAPAPARAPHPGAVLPPSLSRGAAGKRLPCARRPAGGLGGAAPPCPRWRRRRLRPPGGAAGSAESSSSGGSCAPGRCRWARGAAARAEAGQGRPTRLVQPPLTCWGRGRRETKGGGGQRRLGGLARGGGGGRTPLR